MTESDGVADPTAEILADIEQTRAELAETVDALSNKLNVKARAGDKVADAKAKVAGAATQAKHKVPEPVQHALDQVGAKAGPVVQSAVQQARPYRKQLGLAAAAGAVVLLILRRHRSKNFSHATGIRAGDRT